MTKMQFITGNDALKKSILSIAKRGKALDKDIHITACSLINHIIQHGDHTLATTLVNSVSAGMRRNALIGWFENFAQVKFDTKEKQFIKANKPNDLQGAIATPFTAFKASEGVDYTQFNWDQRLSKLIADAEKAQQAGVNIDPQAIKALTAMVNPDTLAKARGTKKKAANDKVKAPVDSKGVVNF